MDKSDNNDSIASLVSTLDTHAIARRLQAHSKTIGARTLVLIISPLNGYGLDEFQHSVSSSNIVVGIGASPHHCREYASHASEIYTSTVPLLYGKDMGSALLKIIHTHYPHRCKIIYYSSEAYRYKAFADELSEKCQLEIKQCWANHATESYFGTKWLHNIWYNLVNAYRKPHVMYGFPVLQDNNHTRESIAVVVGAGPSLNKHVLEYIAKHRAKLTLFAADTALPTLHRYGISPDFTTLLESQVHNMKDLVPAPDSHIVAIGDLCCYPPSLRSFSHTCYVATQFASLSFFTRHATRLPPLIPPLGSVGIMAVYMAIHAGFHHILLAGLDFSYFRGLSHSWSSAPYTHWLNTHHRTAPWHNADSHFSNPRLRLIPSSAETQTARVYDPTLHAFRLKFEQSIAALIQQYQVSCYDLNQESILHGIPIIDMSQAHALLQSSSSMSHPLYKKDVLNNNYKHFTNADAALQILTEERALLQRLLSKIEYLETHAQLPSQQDWRDGLDTLAFTLVEDPYRIRNDVALWKEHALYIKLTYNAHKILHDIATCLSYAQAG